VAEAETLSQQPASLAAKQQAIPDALVRLSQGQDSQPQMAGLPGANLQTRELIQVHL
jgi:hypothetical protein